MLGENLQTNILKVLVPTNSKSPVVEKAILVISCIGFGEPIRTEE